MIRQITIRRNYDSWHDAARRALSMDLPPGDIHWQELEDDQPSLAMFDEAEDQWAGEEPPARTFRVPRTFPVIARRVACHANPGRWALLYSALWRITHGEPRLLEIASDADTAELMSHDRAVRHEVHKMRAFVRFREVSRGADAASWFVAWFEPEHHIVELNALFFIDRFANMCWSILTPDRCMHWNGEKIVFDHGISKSEAPTEDAVEDLWLKYYAQIFNPARVKTRAMTHSMPKRYWKNLPEAAIISNLVKEAPARVETMISQSNMKRIDDLEWRPATPPATRSLRELAAAAAGCTACPLFKNATQTVFGEGPRNAEIVFVGEQPGDQEDLAGKPFVGPAGQLLDRALEEAGVDRKKCYVTNAVKHFKWEPRGKRRLHAKPNSRDIAACRPWLEAELSILKPRILVCLGATAAGAILGPSIRVTKDRGQFIVSPFCDKTVATVHPSSLLRAPTEEDRRKNYELFVEDLRLIAS